MSVRPGEIPCPACGGGVDLDVSFCGYCGQAMPPGRIPAELATMLCDRGKKHQVIALQRTGHHNYCTVCGNRFDRKTTERSVS